MNNPNTPSLAYRRRVFLSPKPGSLRLVATARSPRHHPCPRKPGGATCSPAPARPWNPGLEHPPPAGGSKVKRGPRPTSAGRAGPRPEHAHTRPSPHPPAPGDPVEWRSACRFRGATNKTAPRPVSAAASSALSGSAGSSVGPMGPERPERWRVVHSRWDSATGCGNS